MVIHTVSHCYSVVDSGGSSGFETVGSQHEYFYRLCHAGLFCEELHFCGWLVGMTDS